MRATLKKIIALALSAVILTYASGCFINDAVDSIRGRLFDTINFEDDSSYTPVEPVEIVECNYYAPIDITYGRDGLTTDSQMECYNGMEEAVYRISEEQNENGLYAVGKIIIDDGDFSEADMRVCISAFNLDNPDVFWLSNQFSYGTMSGKTTLQLYSYVSGTECAEKVDALNTAVENIVTSIPANLNQYHLEKYIHNTILDSCDYAENVRDIDDGWTEFSAYGALVGGSAVCEGYSYAMSLLLNNVGIPTSCVSGSSNGELHMWNVVQIDGNWYHIDSTWDDSEGTYYSYFNLTQTQIESDHTIAGIYTEMSEDKIAGVNNELFNIFVPECTADSANYFVVESTYVYDFDECTDIMVNDLVQAANNKDSEFTIKFDSSIEFNEALNVMFYEEPYYMFGYIAGANEQLGDGNKISNDAISIIIIENFNSVVVKLEYA